MQLRLDQVIRRPQEVRTPGDPWPDVRRIVVVRNDRLGDLVLTLPAVVALRAAYPSAHLTLLVRSYTAPIARIVEGVDDVIEDVGVLSQLVGVLRERQPDLLVAISLDGKTALAGAAAGIRHRIGPGYRAYSPLFERCVNEHRNAGERHEAEYALSYAHRAGASGGPAIFPLRIPHEAEEDARRWIVSNAVVEPFIVLHPGGGGSCPPWPAEHFGRLAEALVREGRTVVLSIGPVDVETARVLDEDAPSTRSLPRFRADLPALSALLRRSSLVVSNSTGPLHLAAAVGARTLALHAPWPTCGVSRWGPYAENGWALVAEHEGARDWSRSVRRRRGAELMASLPPEVVLEGIRTLL